MFWVLLSTGDLAFFSTRLTPHSDTKRSPACPCGSILETSVTVFIPIFIVAQVTLFKLRETCWGGNGDLGSVRSQAGGEAMSVSKIKGRVDWRGPG